MIKFLSNAYSRNMLNGTDQDRMCFLFTMLDNPPDLLERRSQRNSLFFFEDDIGSGDQTIWWSQTGSNRRPHACKARALPAELWPRTRRRMLRTRSKWWAWEDLNFRPHAYQARALTN